MSYPQNLVVPYRGLIPSGIFPGRMIRVQGTVHPSAQRFAINLQCGPNTEPRDNIALHFSPQFVTHTVIRNSLQNLMWGPEESLGYFPFSPGQAFEIILLCEATHFKIAVNGAHYTEFEHRLAFQTVSHITIDGDIQLSAVRFEDPPPEVVPGGTAMAPASGYIMPMAYDPSPAIYPSVNPPAYSAYAPDYPQTYVVENQSSGGMGKFGSAAAGAAAGLAIGGLGGYAISNALHSGSSSSDSD
ncbi:galectin-7-like [Thrips palmi]|uniref:Galectin n=1 Tax=Thrips palmi TaxID=161013 RepID=A0A6P9AF40_THRPL|nr:galectin-7-like [Thrips palmi]XP_034255939.1 galectin-7-like [Thrips palmi]